LMSHFDGKFASPRSFWNNLDRQTLFSATCALTGLMVHRRYVSDFFSFSMGIL